LEVLNNVHQEIILRLSILRNIAVSENTPSLGITLALIAYVTLENIVTFGKNVCLIVGISDLVVILVRIATLRMIVTLELFVTSTTNVILELIAILENIPNLNHILYLKNAVVLEEIVGSNQVVISVMIADLGMPVGFSIIVNSMKTVGLAITLFLMTIVNANSENSIR